MSVHLWIGPGAFDVACGTDNPARAFPAEDRDRVSCPSCRATLEPTPDPVNSPSHYTWLGGVEVIDITEHLSFTLGNVIKYVLRADHKGKPLEDLRKAAWYLQREIARREATPH